MDILVLEMEHVDVVAELGAEPPSAYFLPTQVSFIPLALQGRARAKLGFIPFLLLFASFRLSFLLPNFRKQV